MPPFGKGAARSAGRLYCVRSAENMRQQDILRVGRALRAQ
jgi:hypothetical protein